MDYRKNERGLLEIFHPETDAWMPVAAPLQDQLGYVVSLSETAKQLILNLQGVLNTLNTLLTQTDAEVNLIEQSTSAIAEDALTVASNTQVANTHLNTISETALPAILTKSTEISTLSNQIRLQIQSVEAELVTANALLVETNTGIAEILSEAQFIVSNTATTATQATAIASSAETTASQSTTTATQTTTIKDSLGTVAGAAVVTEVGAHSLLTFVKSLFSFLRPQQMRWEVIKVTASGNYAIGANGIAVFRAKESTGTATIQGIGSPETPFNLDAGRSYSASSANGQDSFTGIAVALTGGAELELILTKRI